MAEFDDKSPRLLQIQLKRFICNQGLDPRFYSTLLNARARNKIVIHYTN